VPASSVVSLLTVCWKLAVCRVPRT